MELYFSLEKIAATDIQIQGPAVDSLINAMRQMWESTEIDGGQELNSAGFSKNDWFYVKTTNEYSSIANAVPGNPVSALAAKKCLSILFKYKARQVGNYDQISQGINSLISQQLGQTTPTGEKAVVVRGKGDYNSLEVSISGMSLDDKKAINNFAKSFIESNQVNGQLPAWGVWKGKVAPFKLFSVKDELSQIYLFGQPSPNWIPRLSEFLATRGFDVTQLASYSQPSQQQQNQQPAVEPNILKARLDPQATGVIQIEFTYSPEAVALVKNIKGRQWDPVLKGWKLVRPDPKDLDIFASAMQRKGFDVNEFLKVVEEYKTAAANNPSTERKPLQVRDVSGTTAYLLEIDLPRVKEDREELSEFIKFSFPPFGKGNDVAVRPENAMRTTFKYKHYLFGTYDDLIRFGILLDSRKWDTKSLKEAIRSCTMSGKLEKTRYTGQLDGYQTKDASGKLLNDAEKFYQDLDGTLKPKDPTFKLYPKQKQGIAWLYSRNNAILGDKTGAGKTTSMLGAAMMRMKQSGGRTLIVTLPSTQQQWIDEISSLFGDEEGKNVSMNPTSNARWIVLTYQDFASTQKKDEQKKLLYSPTGVPLVKRQKVQAVLDALSTSQFAVTLLDEAHMLKNDSAAKSVNLSHVVKNIPFRWAGSATPAANTPDDIHNLLRMVGHNLGKINDAMFKREFVGQKMKIKDMAGSEEKRLALKKLQQESALRLRKWLTLSGAYISRSKKAMNPNIPDHTVSEYDIEDEQFDKGKYWRDFSDRLNKYKKPDLAISQMIGERITLAMNKVPATLAQAVQVLDRKDEQGNPLRKKVLCFSCFQEPCQLLVNGLRQHLAKTDPSAQVRHIMGDDKRVDVVQAIAAFRNDKNARGMVISSLKGGTGVNLPNTTEDVLNNDFDWTPKVTEQVEGRAYRINNVIPVHTQYMIAKGTPDEVFYRYVRAKIDLSNLIQDMDSELEEKMLVGIDDKDLRGRLMEAKDKLDLAEAGLVHDLRAMMEAHGIQPPSNMDPSQFDLDAAEMGDDNKEDVKTAISVNGWYGNAKIAELEQLVNTLSVQSS